MPPDHDVAGLGRREEKHHDHHYGSPPAAIPLTMASDTLSATRMMREHPTTAPSYLPESAHGLHHPPDNSHAPVGAPRSGSVPDVPSHGDDGSLMHLYESRLRRLREYENRVYSRYGGSGNISSSNGSPPIDRPTTEARQLSALDSNGNRLNLSNNLGGSPAGPAAEAAVRPVAGAVGRHDPPSVINLDGGYMNDGDETYDDSITVSTGFQSTLASPMALEDQAFIGDEAGKEERKEEAGTQAEVDSEKDDSELDETVKRGPTELSTDASPRQSADINRPQPPGDANPRTTKEASSHDDVQEIRDQRQSERELSGEGVSDTEGRLNRSKHSQESARDAVAHAGDVDVEVEVDDGGSNYDVEDGGDDNSSRSSTAGSFTAVNSDDHGPANDRDCPSHQGSAEMNRYTYMAAMDSKYQSYQSLVDPDQEDRSVEISLYTAQRPHMRAFHYAWLGFFVAFFNWFGITPLLSEVSHSLGLTRTQIWNSNTLAVAGSALTRVMAGPLNDIYGARMVMSVPLLISGIPAILSGLVIQGATSLYIIRFLVGVAGCTFVTCQFWTARMFTVEVAGTALSLVAGWGNLGGGVSQIVMGSILFPLFKVIYGGKGYGRSEHVYPEDGEIEYERSSDLAWRTILAIPGLMCCYVAIVVIRGADDTPKGNFRKRKKLGLMAEESPYEALKRGAANINTWVMFVQYSCCFGVELTMTSAAALYFQEEFGQSTASAAAIASVFGWMNLFARGLGGFASDMANATYGMRGRLWIQLFCLFAEGVFVCIFSVTHSLAGAIIVMALFSIFVQAAEGSSFGIVPYFDYSVTGSISGIVGAGGNIGAVVFSLVFRAESNRTAFFIMGCIVLASSFMSAFYCIPGHRSLFFGQDAEEVQERRRIHAGQVGNVPHVEFQNSESHVNRQGRLREDVLPAAAAAHAAVAAVSSLSNNIRRSSKPQESSEQDEGPPKNTVSKDKAASEAEEVPV